MDTRHLYDIISRTSLQTIRQGSQGRFGGMIIKLSDYNCISAPQRPVYEALGKIMTVLENLDADCRRLSLSITPEMLVGAVEYAISSSEDLPIPEHSIIGELEAAWVDATDDEQNEFAAILQAFQAIEVLLSGSVPALDEERAKLIDIILESPSPEKESPVRKPIEARPTDSKKLNKKDYLENLAQLAEKYEALKGAYNAYMLSKNQKQSRYYHDFCLFDAYVYFSFALQGCQRSLYDPSVLDRDYYAIYRHIILDETGEVAKVKKLCEEVTSTSKAISKRIDYQANYVHYQADETNPVEVEANAIANKKLADSLEKNIERVERLKKLGRKFPRAYYYVAQFYIAYAKALDEMKVESGTTDVGGLTVEDCLEQSARFMLKYFFRTYKQKDPVLLNRCLYEIFIFNADFSLRTNPVHLIQAMMQNLNMVIEDQSDVEAAKLFIEEAQSFYVGKLGRNHNLKRAKISLLSIDCKFKPIVHVIVFVIQALLALGLMFNAAMLLPYDRMAESADLYRFAMLGGGILVSIVIGYLFGGKIAVWNRLVLPLGIAGMFALGYVTHMGQAELDVEHLIYSVIYPYLAVVSPAIALCFTKPYRFRALIFDFKLNFIRPLIMSLVWGGGILFLLWANSHVLWLLEIIIYLALGVYAIVDSMSSEFISHFGERMCARSIMLWITTLVFGIINGGYQPLQDVFIVMAAVTILMYPAYSLCAFIHDRASKL